MQQPTLRDFRLRNVQDALKVFYACHLGILPLITRRLDNEERQALRPGDAYVWEGRNPQTDVSGLGIERWTEGKKWSQSRVREDLLYYYEKFPDGKAPPIRDRLIRQTYSATVNDPISSKPRKLGLSTYYTENSLEHLRTVDEIPQLRNLDVPDGLFARERKTNSKLRQALSTSPDRNSNSSGATRSRRDHIRHTVTRMYAPYPVPTVSPAPYHSVEEPRKYTPPTPPYVSSPGYVSYPAHHPLPNYQYMPQYRTSTSAEPSADPATIGGYSYPFYVASPHATDPNMSSRSPRAISVYGEVSSPRDTNAPTSHRQYSFSEQERGWAPPSPSPSLTEGDRAVPRARASSDAEMQGNGARGSIGGPVYLAPLSTLRKEANYRRDPADDWALRQLNQKQDCV